MIRNVAPKLVPDTFPLTIRKGHASVKIYEVKDRSDRLNYTVSYMTAASGRKRKTFAKLVLAKEDAARIAQHLADGDLEALKLTGVERQLYVTAQRLVDHTGIPLDSAAREFARAYDILGHGGIVEAARYFKKHVETGLPEVSVSEAVARFAEAKKKEGLSKLYLKDIRCLLGRFAADFQCNIGTLQSDDLRAYLNAMKTGPVSKNNHRRMLTGLFSFARNEGWLRANEKTAPERLGDYKVKARDVEIYTPAEVARLLAHADEDFLPWVALIAFGGIRNEELHKGLMWEAINFHAGGGYLIVSAGISKTSRKRKIDLSENLLEWLKPYRHRHGPIFNHDYRKPLKRMCEGAKVKWKRNGLRHSFGSYRMEILRNAGHVALEMGNSAAVVQKHYFEIVEKEAAERYWSIRPVANDRKIVRLAQAKPPKDSPWSMNREELKEWMRTAKVVSIEPNTTGARARINAEARSRAGSGVQ